MALPETIALDAIRTAADRLRRYHTPSPLLPVEVDGGMVHLKCENLSPIGSFKIRGAGNAMLAAPRESLREGVVTASAGNMAQGVAWWARRLGVPCTAVVPERAPAAKLVPFQAMGGVVRRVAFEEWWETLVRRGHPDVRGHFIHPVADPEVIAGNGTIGLELAAACPEAESVLVPFGGGGLACGIAAALRGLGHPGRVIACEVETAAPLTASLAAGEPVAIAHTPSWVDGIGGGGVLPEMWPLIQRLVPEAVVSSLDEIGAAVRYLAARAHLVAEGAGAAGLAPVLAGRVRAAGTVVILSGGNIDPPVLAGLLDPS